MAWAVTTLARSPVHSRSRRSSVQWRRPTRPSRPTICCRMASRSPIRQSGTRTLGNAPRVEVDIFSGLQLEMGDALVLVSDGVTGYLDESDFTTVLLETDTAQAAAERLVAEAVERGGADNATAVVVRRR